MYKTLSASLLCCLFIALNAQAKIKLSGEVAQGGLIIGKTLPGSTVSFDRKPIAVSNQGDFVFGFGRDDIGPYQLQVTTPNGEQEIETLVPARRHYDIQRIEGIKKSIMKPNPTASARAKKDNQQIAIARETASELTAFANGFVAPINGEITGVYGSQRVFNGEAKRPHFGLDYAGKKGDPVHAPAEGKVLLFEADMFYSGGTMIIDHGHGVTSTFLHLSKSYVTVGETVHKGQLVAAVGASGRATGPHLDWRVNWFDVRIDPASALKINSLK